MSSVGRSLRGQRATLPAGLRTAEANTRWLARHPEAWREHAGEWLCIVDEQLVVAERDRRRFAEQVQQVGDRDGALILRIPTGEELAAVHPATHPW